MGGRTRGVRSIGTLQFLSDNDHAWTGDRIRRGILVPVSGYDFEPGVLQHIFELSMRIELDVILNVSTLSMIEDDALGMNSGCVRVETDVFQKKELGLNLIPAARLIFHFVDRPVPVDGFN